MIRHYSSIDRFIIQIERTMNTVAGKPEITERLNPAQGIPEPALSLEQRRHSAGLMRVNHAGEVCAQALYQGQALTARQATVHERMARAAQEENDHLAWCQQRLTELASHSSYLNSAWYAGALTIGAVAGLAGDDWSLGFVAETERQVAQHLDRHLQQLPVEDRKSRLILEQMKADELHHADWAMESGGKPLPMLVRWLMRLSSKIMTKTAYWV